MIEKILDLIYPNVCGFCNKINKESLCEDCKIKLKKLDITKIDNYNNKSFNKHIYIFKYERVIRDLLLNYKFNEKVYLYKTISNIILNNKKVCSFIKKYDIIVPVPLHKKRFNDRGYNQCELILKEINELNMNNKILAKTVNNIPQSRLNKEERIKNIKNVYMVKNIECIKNKKILLFDDIFTTGSTVNECARVLMKNGAKEVGVFTIAKD